jgi:acyl-coenzyme A thioesterase PaaI-like protein
MDLIGTWNKFKVIPSVGPMLFSAFLGRVIPYTGSIRASVEHLEPGHARISFRDHRGIRNHLNSIHAVALMNLAEFVSGLTFMSAMPKGVRAILVGFEVEFVKKARGKISGEARFESPDPNLLKTERLDHILPVELTDSTGEVVCRAKAKWKSGPTK